MVASAGGLCQAVAESGMSVVQTCAWQSTSGASIRGSCVMDTLRIYGNLSLLEMAPVLLAARQLYPGETLIEHGSVMALWGKASDLASLTSAGQAHVATNSETQALRGSYANPDLRFIFTVA